MLWPALQVLFRGELTSEQLRLLQSTLRLEEVPRTEGPGTAGSIAHRSFIDDMGTRLVLDLARIGESGWELALFFEGQPPSADTIEGHRALLREAVERFRLILIEVTPPATADEVSVMPASVNPDDDMMVTSWELPYHELDQMWAHLGLRKDAPLDVKAVKLRELMRTPAWSVAPPTLRREAQAFLHDV